MLHMEASRPTCTSNVLQSQQKTIVSRWYCPEMAMQVAVRSGQLQLKCRPVLTIGVACGIVARALRKRYAKGCMSKIRRRPALCGQFRLRAAHMERRSRSSLSTAAVTVDPAVVGSSRQEFELTHSQGTVQGVVVREGTGPCPTVLVNAGCYGTLASLLERAEGPRYASQGYAYVIIRAAGSREEIADSVFLRWRDDAAVTLDWLGKQSWCNGRVGVHGYSLLGNTAYAAVAASRDPDAPSDRPVVCAAIPAISFNRIQPTVYVQGEGLAAELCLRFLWLAEVGLRPELFSNLGALIEFAGFFALLEWPGLDKAVALRPVANADDAIWGRQNVLWREGQTNRTAQTEF